MKKLMAMLLVILMVVSLAACSGPDDWQTEETEGGNASSTTGDDKENTSSTEEENTSSTAGDGNETESSASTQEEIPSGLRLEFKEAMDSYEAFYAEYCKFMKEYRENPSDLTLLVKYADMLAKAGEMNEAFEAWDEEELSSEELKYYLDVNNRVMKMLVDVAG